MFYTTGRLTSEMVIKTVQMQIPILISALRLHGMGRRFCVQANLTLIGRAKGKRLRGARRRAAYRVRCRSALRARGIAQFSVKASLKDDAA